MLAVLYGGVPIVFKLAAIVLIARHDLDEAAHNTLRGQIESGWSETR